MERQAIGTVAELIRLNFERLTRSEKQIANTLLSDYPVAGLSSITEFARSADVSSPTVIRTVQKLGFSGFPEFQNKLRSELSAQLSTPLTRRAQWAVGAPESHILNTFAAAVVDNIQQSLKLIDHLEFDRIVDLIADTDRSIHLVGGRVTHVVADYLSTYLEGIRHGVVALPPSSSHWPQHLLGMTRGDVLLVFDMRRYERNLNELAQLAHKRGVSIVVFTDQWISPISAIATHTIPVRIEVPSSSDSTVATVFMAEALLAAVAERLWPDAETRIRDLEDMFDATGRFGKQRTR